MGATLVVREPPDRFSSWLRCSRSCGHPAKVEVPTNANTGRIHRAQVASQAVRELTVSGDDFLFAACKTFEGGTENPTVKLKREVGAGADACKLLVAER